MKNCIDYCICFDSSRLSINQLRNNWFNQHRRRRIHEPQIPTSNECIRTLSMRNHTNVTLNHNAYIIEFRIVIGPDSALKSKRTNLSNKPVESS
ncbi:hypothetical protein BLOT_003388 [Blomia tropicalis]|nr:hypothetical protein BLOT_003388 [Blomia tropicalis]